MFDTVPGLQCGRHVLKLDVPKIMAIVNVTPDSFSDGGRLDSTASAVSHALKLVEQGADMLDIGGESTRPNAEPVSLQEELDRVKAAQEATIAKLTMDNGSLSKERNELGLLVKVAESYGFLRSMAAPNLTGEITNVSNNRLCTVAIRGNEGNVDIADQIAKGKWSFAIYDATGYKGEAVARSYDASVNSVLCDIVLVKGEVKQGDQAKTKL